MPAEEKKSPHLRSETTDSEFRLVDEEFLQAKDLINVFLKPIKAFRLYPADNPTLVGMQEQLFRRFQTYKVIFLFPAFSEVIRRKISGFFWLRPI